MSTANAVFLGRLKDHRAKYAEQALSAPPATDPAYALGEHVGYMKGLAMAEQLLIEVLKGEERDEPETYVGRLAKGAVRSVP